MGTNRFLAMHSGLPDLETRRGLSNHYNGDPRHQYSDVGSSSRRGMHGDFSHHEDGRRASKRGLKVGDFTQPQQQPPRHHFHDAGASRAMSKALSALHDYDEEERARRWGGDYDEEEGRTEEEAWPAVIKGPVSHYLRTSPEDDDDETKVPGYHQ